MFPPSSACRIFEEFKESFFKQFAFVLNFLDSERKSVNFKDGLTGIWESEE